MNRSTYFNSIEEKIGLLAYRLEVRGGLNILDLHLHSENFYLHFLNLLFGWDLENLNVVLHNAPGIDLIDKKNRIIVQVSATATKNKVESALGKDLSAYKGYSFKFIAISKDAKGLRTKTFLNPHELVFLPAQDIFDVTSLLELVCVMDIDRQKEISGFLKKELKSEPDPEKVELNLTTIITVLAKEDWGWGVSAFEKDPYAIEAKISFNQLDVAAELINEHKIHCSRIEKIYADFNKAGVNKSLSILNGIRSEYIALSAAIAPDDCFLSIIEKVAQKIRASANYVPMPDEELMFCVQVLVVDAFIRCKIFKNPSGAVDAYS